jgi:hypothetical protein
MISDFLNRSEFLSSQWAPVVGIGLLFFLVQVVLCISVCFRLRRQERGIKRLEWESKETGDGRHSARSLGRKHAWVNWVVAHFSGGPAQQSNFTREDALQELDTQIASNGNYLLLQRMGIMAPLLGVVLTVAGFYWLRVGSGDESLQSILSAVTPLVSGVGTGAVLALINQVLLHIAGRRVESLRMTARRWFDAAIWSSSRREMPLNAVNAPQVMEQFIRTALEDMNRLGETLVRAREISAALSTLPVQVRTILDRKLAAEHKPNPAPTDASGHFATRLPRAAVAPKPTPK